MPRRALLSIALLVCAGLYACAAEESRRPDARPATPATPSTEVSKSPGNIRETSPIAAGAAATSATISRAPATTLSTTPATTQARATDKNPIPTTQPESPDLPVPFLTAEEAIRTFDLAPGFRAEVVAAEPMVQHPVAITFDADGRLWVCEMRGYMPTFDGQGEDQPTGRVSVLEDTNGDGRMDKSTVFMDQLVLPRAIAIARDGVLVGVPPNLLFCRDTDGDGKADEKTVVATDYGDPRQNPEHQANGLMYGLDNWVRSADYGKRFKDVAGKWVADTVPDVGQWGISQDDYGRVFTDNNSDYLRADLVPSHYTVRNANYHGSGANVQLDDDQTCWPAHPSAVNRGYRDNYLRDGRLRKFTATCAPLVYRAELFGREFYGNVFVAEPSANLIRRAVLSEEGVVLTGRNAYPEREFLASSYERFRPVNLTTGPDGALYVVDMHHGILQHRQYLTPYLKDKYLKRLLNEFLLTGRIYRIVPDGAGGAGGASAKRPPAPQLSKAKTPELIAALSHPDGWWRTTAQRLLVERNYSGATGPLKALATKGENPLGRMHALWTLEGMRRLDAATARTALADPNPRVRATAIRVSEFLITNGRGDEIIPDLLKLADDAEPHVRLQFALTVGEVGTPAAEEAIARMLGETTDQYTRDGAITGMRGRELEFLERLLGAGRFGARAVGGAVGGAGGGAGGAAGAHGIALGGIAAQAGGVDGVAEAWREKSPGRAGALAALAKAVRSEARPKRVVRLLELMADQTGPLAWRQDAMVRGAVESARARPVVLEKEPVALASLRAPAGSGDAAREKLLSSFVWPGKPGYAPPPPPKPLSAAQQARFESGRSVYAATCIQCHKIDGQGQVGLAPQLIDSEWILGGEERVVRIVLNGIRGPITVGGQNFNLDMPGLATLNDEQVASVLTYVRREWDHAADPIDPATVQRIRAELNGRSEAWTVKELLEVPVRATKPKAPPSPAAAASNSRRATGGD